MHQALVVERAQEGADLARRELRAGRLVDEQHQADLIPAEIEDRHAARIGADSYAEFRRLLRSLTLRPRRVTGRRSGHRRG
jgi:hypothetical protein